VLALSGWCLSNAALPYFPFVEAFESHYSIVDSGLTQQQELKYFLFGTGKAEGRIIAPQVWKDQIFAAVSKELLYMSTIKPIILFIDDLHWADSASLALLHYIARSAISERLLVIATFRSEEISHKPKGQPHPLAEALRLMAREDLFKELKLKNLTQADVGRIVESMLGGSLDSRFVEKLSLESSGNPLFVVEALRLMYSQGTLVRKHGQWRLMNDNVEIPPKVRDIIVRRLEALRPSQRKILDVASVIGEKFDPRLIADVFSQDDVDVLQSLKTVSQYTLLVFNEGDDYKFEHAKIQEMLYQDIPPPLKKEFHSRIAAILEAKNQGSKEFPFSDVAYHYAQAGNKEKAIKYALAAGQNALEKWSNVQAIEHFRYVLQNASAHQTQEKRVALEGLGDAYAANCMYAEAIKTFDELAASETGALRLRALRKAMDAAFIKGDKPDLLLDYAKKAQELGVCDRLEMARVLQNRGRAFAWAGRGDMKLDLADYEAALKVFEEENSLADVAEALGRRGGACTFLEGLYKKVLGELLLSVAIFKELGDARKEIDGTLHLGLAFSRGLLSEARQELFKVVRVGEKLGAFAELARAYGILSLLDESDGKLEEALSQILKALEYYEKTDANYIQGLDLSALTRLYSKLGDLKHADEYFEKMAKLPPIVFSNPLVGSMILISKGVYFAAKSQWNESNQAFKNLAYSGWTGYEEYYAWALEKQGRFAEAKVQRNRVQKRLKQIEERFRHASLQMSLLMPRKVNVEEAAEMQLYITNIGKSSGTLVRIEGLLPSGSKVTSMPPFCSVQNSSIEFNQKEIGAFQVEPIKLRIAFDKPGANGIQPILFYSNNQGGIKTNKAKPISVNVQFGSSERKLGRGEGAPCRFGFKSEAAEKAFNFLVSAFEEDYFRRRLPQEKSGWRTLMEIVKNAHVTMHSMYGRCGRGGKATLELGHLGLVESRFFVGERGRGGNVLKLRICYEKEDIKRRLSQKKVWGRSSKQLSV
jgi:tetratricopeptide (TPR) repeat protein